jgi:plastocyanin
MIMIATRRWLGAVAALGAGAALAGGPAAALGAGATVRAIETPKVVINKYLQIGLHFAPGTVMVKSGSMLTFTLVGKQDEPHTLTIVPKASLPKTVAQVENCAVCQRLATPHLKNPKAPPDQNNPIVHFVLNKGQAGLDTVGDSIAVLPQGPHRSISIQVTAAPGTTLNFICAIHPWMQGRITVT